MQQAYYHVQPRPAAIRTGRVLQRHWMPHMPSEQEVITAIESRTKSFKMAEKCLSTCIWIFSRQSKCTTYNCLSITWDDIFRVTSLLVFFTLSVVSYNPGQNIGTPSKLFPSPYIQCRKLVFFSLLVKKNATFSNIDEGNMWSSLNVRTTFVWDPRLKGPLSTDHLQHSRENIQLRKMTLVIARDIREILGTS